MSYDSYDVKIEKKKEKIGKIVPRAIPTHRPPLAGRIRQSAIRRYESSPQRMADKRFYASDRWRSFRAAYLREHPLCVDCQGRGIITAAEHVHHVSKRKDDPEAAFDEGNCMGLCEPCHSVRTGRGE